MVTSLVIDMPPDADARFDRTVQRWFTDRFELEPDRATNLGLHDHDASLPSGSRDHIDRLIEFHSAAIREMERFDAAELSADRSLDRDLLIHEARLILHELSERRSWAGATHAAQRIGDALFPLMVHDFAPLPERLESAAGRLEAIPGFLAETRRRVEEPVRLWVEVDMESTAALPLFLDSILAAAGAEHVGDALTGRLETAVGHARAALAEHGDWLRADAAPRATADWRTGPEQFEELLALRALEAGADEILAVGHEILAAEISARDAVCTEIDPTLDPLEVADVVKDDHPATFAEALDAYRESMDRARTFVVEHELAGCPQHDTLRVVETPVYLRPTHPFAAYYEPAPFDPEPTGIYIVTPPETAGMMREHNYASISNTSVHEAYPGHHLQLATAVENPSRVRLMADSAAEFAEGWAFYCERLMKELGFDDTPRHRYIQHTDAIWRACRIILDIRLHRGEIGTEEAVDFLVERTGFERPAAIAEVKRYTSSPTYQLSYLYGRHMIDELRRRVQRTMGPAFTPRFFHDTLLRGGTLPVSFARRLFEARLGSLSA